MKRYIYIILAFLFVACVEENFPEDQFGQIPSGVSSQIMPAASVSSVGLPPAATKALVSAGTVAKMEANALRIDEIVNDSNGTGTDSFEGWDDAYLLEATVASSPSSSASGYLRSMRLNPVQAYKMNLNGQDTSAFYHTRMISWYPRTCNLYKDDNDNAVVTHFADFRDRVDSKVYSEVVNGGVKRTVLNFPDLDGTKDVMVSNIVEGQHWHTDDGSEGSRYTLPFGQNDSKPQYTNSMTYKHYLSAVKVYAWALNSDQVVTMWGALKSVMVKNQPSAVSVVLPNPDEMRDATIQNRVQMNQSMDQDYGTAVFSTELVDFPLIKTAMYGDDPNNPDDGDVAEDSPYLKPGEKVYLGYALVKPFVEGEADQKLELDIHTESGILSVAVPMSGTDTNGNPVDYFKAGFVYNIEVSFNTEGAIADIVLNSGNERYWDLSSSTVFDGGIHDYKYSNCYIIHPNFEGGPYDGYAFNATTVGNGHLGLYANSGFDRSTVQIDPVRAGLLWESSLGLITQVELLYGYVRFKADPNREGNAVIAVYDSQRRILWSWHIWITDEPQDISYTIGGNEIKLMDRNLGATSAVPASTDESEVLKTYGLYYQWGRKDPSMGPPSAEYIPQSTETSLYYDYYATKWNYAGVVTMAQPTLRDGVENPMYLILPTDFSMTTYQYDWLYTNIDNLWGDYDHSAQNSESKRQKTIYDPCPFGYMVPQDEISSLFGSSTYGKEITIKAQYPNGMYVEGKDKDSRKYESWFPFAGYKGVDRGVSSLSGAWRHVGFKGDYMSSKIDLNKHRSRTYISYSDSWDEFGADSDGDGDGDALREYRSRIFADDMANRRTAASVRCVKRTNALNASIYSSFYADHSFAFVDDAPIQFKYSASAYGVDDSGNPAVISSAYIDENESKRFNLTAGSSTLSGTREVSVPNSAGIYRYRLVAESSTGAVSRVSYPVHVFDLRGINIDGKSYKSTQCKYGTPYTVSFQLDGMGANYTVYVNGVPAEVGGTGLTCTGVYISDHMRFQICDANGVEVAYKEFPVKMKSFNDLRFYIDITKPVTFDLYNGQDSYLYNPNDYRDEPAFVYKATELEAGALYFIGTYKYSTPWFNPNYWRYGVHGKEDVNGDPVDPAGAPALLFPGDYEDLFLDYINSHDIKPKDIFMFHKDDSKAGGVSTAYHFVTAGAWRTLVDGKYLTKDFTFSASEADAAYTTVANGWDTPGGCVDIDLYLGNTGQFLQCDRWAKTGRDDDFFWWSASITNEYKWRIYKIKVEEKQ